MAENVTSLIVPLMVVAKTFPLETKLNMHFLVVWTMLFTTEGWTSIALQLQMLALLMLAGLQK
eukprot:4265222-Amphidinium_carterae.1